MNINIKKLNTYLGENNEMAQQMIMEFESKDDAIDFFNINDGTALSNVNELINYEDKYGFSIGNKWYHILYDEALDVYEDRKGDASMLKLKDGEGYVYVSEKTGHEYTLLIGDSIGIDATSDLCFIMHYGKDSLKCEYVDYFCGATAFEDNLQETEKIIKGCVDKYESQQNYRFTKEDIQKFMTNSFDYCCEKQINASKEWFKDHDLNIHITIGNNHITVPGIADSFEELTSYLTDCRENTIDLVNRMEKKEVTNGCYSAIIQELWKIFSIYGVDGWYGIDFFKWFEEAVKDSNENGTLKYIYVCIATDGFAEIVYGNDLNEIQLKEGSNPKYYMIECTEDCVLYELV